jgi:putative DNA primase/helicase|tara:strand:+ start:774 stop:2228 length:1455 start_codon:yes stop_codon:yes gene_type:complete
MKMDEPKLNWELKKAIELESQNKFPELVEHLKNEGRLNQTKETLREIQEKSFTYKDDKGKEKVSIPKVTSHILFNYYIKTIYGRKEETVYVYNNGIYEERGKELIKSKTEKLLKEKCTSHIVKEVFEKIKRNTAINQVKFNHIPLNLICLENGILNVKTKELIKFNPDYYFKNKIPIKYDKESKTTKILQFINEIFYPEDIPVIQEFLGFCLFKRYFIKKAIILFGEKNTGKTVFLNILTKFIGELNTSGVSLQKIASKDKFALSYLKDKYTNIYDDLSVDDLKDAGGFKIATGGGYITAEYKFGDPFQFMTFAKNIFATNTIPNVKDINDDAYYERWIPLCLHNQISKEEQDTFLFERITTDEELSGLLNWALIGLDRLFEKGSFSFDKTSEEIKGIMQRQNNPLVAFVDEVLKQQNGNKISKEIMYRIYSKWCQDKKVPRLSKEQLGRNLAKYTNYIIAKGGKERVWENVNIKPNSYTYDTF